jgi:hypothetical protein
MAELCRRTPSAQSMPTARPSTQIFFCELQLKVFLASNNVHLRESYVQYSNIVLWLGTWYLCVQLRSNELCACASRIKKGRSFKSFRDQQCRSYIHQLKILRRNHSAQYLCSAAKREMICVSQVVYYLCGVLCPAFDFTSQKKLGFGTSKLEKNTFCGMEQNACCKWWYGCHI